jgi:hypothetical protein
MNAESRFAEAIQRIDDENARDPNLVLAGGALRPRELVYAEWLTEWVKKLCPAASEPLLLAARCQHICRWMFPRSSFEMARAGYLKWREHLRQFHAEKAAEILRAVGYAEETIARVRDLNLKKNLSNDPYCQVLEDALCLVTLQYQLGELADKTDPEKMVSILQKTWKKMSPNARNHALGLSYSEREKELIARAGLVV